MRLVRLAGFPTWATIYDQHIVLLRYSVESEGEEAGEEAGEAAPRRKFDHEKDLELFAKMIEEEIRSLDLRVRQRAAALSETLVAGTNTINMVKHYWLRLLDGSTARF